MADSLLESFSVARADGRRLEVLVSGPLGSLPLVFHLGTPNGLVPLPLQIYPGSSVGGVVMYARPGYCGSTPQPGRTVPDAAADTAAILDAIGVDKFVTAGWSGGGPPALACAALLPGRCLAAAVIAGLAPYSEAVSDSYEEGDDYYRLALGAVDAFELKLQEDRAAALQANMEDLTGMFACEADRAALTGEYAEWLLAYWRSGWSAGVAGIRDDYRSVVRDWNVELAEAKTVAIWQGEQDHNVPPGHGVWLAEHIPGAELHLFADEGHMSIGLRLPDIVQDLLARAGDADPLSGLRR
jgi:pimeloyl-ACP methyl ester carboxylesterase